MRKRFQAAWTLLASLLLCALLSGGVSAAPLTAADAESLRSDIASMTAAFERGDAEPLIERTHASLKALAGGPDAFAELTRYALAQLKDIGISFVSQEVGMPTDVYEAGEEEVCFVPRISVMALKGAQMKSTTFMIAIRSKGGTTWTYLDGAGLRNNPEMIYQLLPSLSRDVPLPPNTLE